MVPRLTFRCLIRKSSYKQDDKLLPRQSRSVIRHTDLGSPLSMDLNLFDHILT